MGREYRETRRRNGEIALKMVSEKINLWK